MLMAMAVTFAVFVVPVRAATDPGSTVRLHSQATVRGTAVTLADIAELSGDSEALLTQLAHMSVGRVGDVALLSRTEIAALIRKAIANPADVVVTGAEFTRVTLAKRAPAAAEIEAVLKSHLATVTQWREDEIAISSIGNLKTIEIPEGNVELRAVNRGAPTNFRRMLLSVEAILDGEPLRAFWVQADIRIRAQVVKVARPVGFKTVLTADDLREQVCDIEDPRTSYFRSQMEAIGTVTRRALSLGELLSRNSVEDAGLVRVGETVRLTVVSGSVRMSVPARALQNGKLGDPIKVRNIDSDRVITAVVTGRKEARIGN